MKQFGYEYLQGTNLLHKLVKPNGMTLTQSYEAKRDLLSDMAYHRGTTLVVQREYTYDILGRPSARNTARQGAIVNDSFTHNTRSELVEAQVNGKDYEYAYDNVGNRTAALEESSSVASSTEYTTNALNQYSSISENGAAAFVPQFDADGNQTLIKTETGIWSAVYNAENRPVSFINESTGTVVTCAYDSLGRRAFKKVTVNGAVTLHQRYIYRGYLQIACCDLSRTAHTALWLITWDPSQPIATRPLAIQKDGTWYTYGLDLTKNVCEVFGNSGYIATSYTYSPYGFVTTNGSVTQPIQWSSEVGDVETGVVYYNFRYYNTNSTTWNRRDPLQNYTGKNLYGFIQNSPISYTDRLGLYVFAVDGTNYNVKTHPDTQYSYVYDFAKRCYPSEDAEYYGGPGSVYTRYPVGPADLTGSSVDLIMGWVKQSVCKKRCAKPHEKINFVGWSRGGIIVQDLARELGESGCCCENKTPIPYVDVNFLGLYDAVARTPHRFENPHKPTNVKHYVHVINTDDSWVFKTYLYHRPNEKVEGHPDEKIMEEYYRKYNIKRIKIVDEMTGAESPATHTDLGGTQDGRYSKAHSIVVNWARNSGVNIRTSNINAESYVEARLHIYLNE